MAMIDSKKQYKYDQALKIISQLNESDPKQELILFYIEELKEQIEELKKEKQEYINFFDTLKGFLGNDNVIFR